MIVDWWLPKEEIVEGGCRFVVRGRGRCCWGGFASCWKFWLVFADGRVKPMVVADWRLLTGVVVLSVVLLRVEDGVCWLVVAGEGGC